MIAWGADNHKYINRAGTHLAAQQRRLRSVQRKIHLRPERTITQIMLPEIAELNNGGCSSCGGSCNGTGGESCCNHVPDGNGLVVIDFDVSTPHAIRHTHHIIQTE